MLCLAFVFALFYSFVSGSSLQSQISFDFGFLCLSSDLNNMFVIRLVYSGLNA